MSKNHTVICQQVFCNFKTRVHHIKPIRMKTTVTIKVFDKTVAVLIILPAVFKIFFCTLSKIILIHKVIARVVWWIYINHLDFAKICFLQQLQYLKVVALNIKIFGVIKINAFFPARAESFIYGCIGKKNRLLLVWPSNLIAFLIAVNNFARNFLHKYILINSTNNFAVFINCFCDSIRKHCC